MFDTNCTNTFKKSHYYTTYQLVKAFHEKKDNLIKGTSRTVNFINFSLLISNFIINSCIQNLSINPLYFYLAIMVNTLLGALFYRLSIKKLRRDFNNFDKSELDKDLV